jgi:glutamate-1-semialdehyde 2,1-aminomutase
MNALNKRKSSYVSDSSRSKKLHERATRVMPGGNTRHSIALSPYPVYVTSGNGCRVTDVEGEERIDFINNFTSLILGHANPGVLASVNRQLQKGSAFSLPTEVSIELAELLVDRVVYIDQIRFCNSGSEAVMLAIKAARSFTGRAGIAKFEGAYHGIYDYAQVSEGPFPSDWGEAEAPRSVAESGSSPKAADDVVVLPWNNFKACGQLISSHKNQLAAILVDVLPTGLGMIAPHPEFLKFLREQTERFGIFLISDEVMSFRLSYHGAMHKHGIRPDLTALGKIVGGGFPVGAVAGSAKAMSVFDHTRGMRVHHGGTFNANPVTTAAGLETMKQMTVDAFERLNEMGNYIRGRLLRMFRDRKVPATICGDGSLFVAHLSDAALLDYRSLRGFSRTNPIYVELCHEMLAQGVVSTPRGLFGCLSTPMSKAELDAFVAAVDRSLSVMNYRP